MSTSGQTRALGKTFGDFTITGRLGQGGMATVYRGTGPDGDEVAIKVIAPQYIEREDFVARFRREARTMASLNHPHILPVIAFGETDDALYLVMKFIDGGTLEDLLGAPVLPDRTAELAEQIAGALTYAHAQGVIHRDLKPANILLDRDGASYLADFGIARLVDSEGRTLAESITQTGMLLGTPAYIAPEQWHGEAATPRCDIYALGVIFYEMLSGRRPFVGTIHTLINQHLNEMPAPPSQLNRALSPAVDKVMMRALAKDPNARFAAAEDFAEALKKALETAAPTSTAAAQKMIAAPLEPTATYAISATVHNLRQDVLDVFAGREAELEQLDTWQTEPDVRAIAITGLGGIGKTALAVRAAWRWRAFFPGGILMIGGNMLEESADNFYLQMDATFNTDIMQKSGAEARFQAAREHLNAQRRLLILDGLDYVPPEQIDFLYELVAGLDVQGAGSMALLTARGQLRLFDRLNARAMVLGPLEENEAVEVLNRLTEGDTYARATLQDRERETVRLAHRHPFLLRLVSSLLRDGDQWEMIRAQLTRLRGAMTEQAIEELIGTSVAQAALDAPHALELLMTLNLFAAGAREEMLTKVHAGAVGRTDDVDFTFDQADSLRVLRRASLVERQRGRYKLQGLVADYVGLRYWDKLDDEDRAAYEKTFIAVFAAFSGSGAAPDELLAERMNFRKAFRMAAEREENAALDIAMNLEGLLWSRGFWDELRAQMEQAAAIGEKMDECAICGHALSRLGTIAGASGDLEGSSGYLQRALDAFYKVKDVIGAAKVLHNLGIVEQHRGDLEKSLEYKQRSLTLFKQAGADERLPLSYAGLAASFSLASDYEAAAQNSLEGLHAAEAVDDAYGIAFNSNNLAEAYRLTGKLADAEYHVNNAVHIATANGLSYPLLMSLETRMQLYLDTGELREALEDGKRALRILENTWVQREADEVVKHFLDSFDKLEGRAAQSAQKEVVSLAQSLNLEGVGAALEAWTPEA